MDKLSDDAVVLLFLAQKQFLTTETLEYYSILNE